MSEPFIYQLQQYNQLTSNIAQIFLSPVNEKIEYLAGQYLEILYADGTYHPFSIANAPQKNGQIEIHIRHTETDLPLKETLQQLKTTKQISLRGPFGHAYYREEINNNNKIIILAGGTGFAYAKAIIEQAIINHDPREFYFYWSVKENKDFYLTDLPEKIWQENLAHFHYIPVLTQTAKKAYAQELIVAEHQDLTAFYIYASGPMQMIENAYKLFLQHELKKIHMYSDMLFFL